MQYYHTAPMMYREPGDGIGGLVFGLVLFVAVILFIVAAYTYLKRSHTGASASSALEVLKTRYAKGEIDKKTFEEMKKDIEG
jgi:putative membrane protein